MKQPKPPIIVCRWQGLDDRFFAKYKEPATGAWKKIPGGPFPPEVNTKTKAEICARRWFETEMADRKLTETTPPMVTTWADVCDGFITSVEARLRGADGTKSKTVGTAKMLKRSPVFSLRPTPEHDEAIVLNWLHEFVRQPKRSDSSDSRHPYTVRNVSNVLREIYRWARSHDAYPRDRILPPDGDEFRAEIKYLLGLVEKREVMCPPESARKLIMTPGVSELRRLLTHIYVLTGLRPGELHGLQFSDLKTQGKVAYFDVSAQWTMKRGNKYPARRAPLKTRWAKRQIPLHPSLRPVVETWATEGWKICVGREPTPNDYLFVDNGGQPFREERSDDFVADLKAAGCPTEFNGIELTNYSLRHTFATLMLMSHVDPDARDRLLGHRPKDVKALSYEVSPVAYLFDELSKIPALIPDDPSTRIEATAGHEFGAEKAVVEPLLRRVR